MVPITTEQLINELVNGIKKRGHPFRCFTLSTLDNQNRPKSRTVVLREVSDEPQLFFFTDARSNKLEQLGRNPNVSALFYHPKKQLQLQIGGKACRITEEPLLQQFWSTLGDGSKRDYTTLNAPGSPLRHPEEVSYLKGSHHFSVVKIVPQSIEYLKLRQPHHLRGIHTLVNGQWQHRFLVP